MLGRKERRENEKSFKIQTPFNSSAFHGNDGGIKLEIVLYPADLITPTSVKNRVDEKVC